MKGNLQVCITVTGLLLLSGCAIDNLTQWADDTFYQSQRYTQDEETIQKYSKSIRLYDQFETVALFDALWNSDEIRTLYARLYATKMGKDEDGYLAFLRRQLSANLYTISFYVLSTRDICLTVTPPVWVVYLEIDGKRYLPSDVKLAEPPMEYVRFFGKKISNHKQMYEVIFERKDADGVDILAHAQVVKLFFSSPSYFGCVGWHLDEQGNATSQMVLDKKPTDAKVRTVEKQRLLGKRKKYNATP